MCRGRLGGQEVRPHRVGDRLQEVFGRDLGQRLLDVAVADEVERDVEAPGLHCHSVDVGVDGLLVERPTSAVPAAPISAASASNLARVRPARKTLAVQETCKDVS
jgi:hypothetical protein